MHDRSAYIKGFKKDDNSLAYITDAIDNYRHRYAQNPNEKKKFIVLDFGVPISAEATNSNAGSDGILKMHISEWKGTQKAIDDTLVFDNPVVHQVTWTIARTDKDPLHLGDVGAASNMSAAMELLNGMSLG